MFCNYLLQLIHRETFADASNRKPTDKNKFIITEIAANDQYFQYLFPGNVTPSSTYIELKKYLIILIPFDKYILDRLCLVCRIQSFINMFYPPKHKYNEQTTKTIQVAVSIQVLLNHYVLYCCIKSGSMWNTHIYSTSGGISILPRSVGISKNYFDTRKKVERQINFHQTVSDLEIKVR